MHDGCKRNDLLEFLQQLQQFPVELVAVEVFVCDVFPAGIDNAERAA
jgi:hypothetical protein